MIVIRYASALPSCANLREHWRARANRVQSQRHTAGVHVFGALQSSHVNCRGCAAGPNFPLVVTLCRIAPRALDDDNLASACKAVRDGVADALGIKDNDPRVTWRYEQRRGAVKEQAIEIRVEARKESAA